MLLLEVAAGLESRREKERANLRVPKVLLSPRGSHDENLPVLVASADVRSEIS